MKLAELLHPPIRRGRRIVLQQASVPLPGAGVVGIVGVNGAGKSTLLHALAGNLRGVRATIAGANSASPVAFAPQEAALPRWLALPDVARLYGHEVEDLARRLPPLLLEEFMHQEADALSAGQRQAFVVALALGSESGLTLLDEPFASLDIRRRFGLLRLLRERRAAGGPGLTLVSSQSAADLLETCDWLLVLRQGRYVYSGAMDAFTAGIAEPARARQRFEEAVLALLGAASPPRFRADSPGSRGRAAAT